MKATILIWSSNWAALLVISMGCILQPKYIMCCQAQGGWGTSLFSHFVFHITGVAVMALALQSLGILTKSDSKPDTEQNSSYWSASVSDCMSDLEIDMGFIGDDVVALCHDHEASYAMFAQKQAARYIIRISSSHGVTSTLELDGDMGDRQLIMRAMSEHLDNVRDTEQGLYDMEHRQSLN